MATLTPGSSSVSFGQFTLDLRTGELFGTGPPTVLPHQPFRLLVTLITRRGELVTRDELRRELWPSDTFVDFEPGLNAAVRRLRDALGDSAETPRFIQTLPRRGYRFISPVTEAPIAVTPAVEPLATPRAAAPAAAAPRPWVPGRRLGLSAAGALIVIAIIGGVLLVLSGLAVRSTDRPELAGRLTNIGTVRLASLAPDGRRLAYVSAEGSRESLWLRGDEGERHVQLLSPVEGVFRSITFGPGEFVYYTLLQPDVTHISLYRVSTRTVSQEMVGRVKGRVSFSRDGSRSASVYTASLGGSASHVVIDDIATSASRIVAVLKPPSNFLNRKPAWSPDGRYLALLARDAHERLEIITIDQASGRERSHHPLSLADVEDLLWISERTFIVAGSERAGLPQRLWRLSSPAMTVQPLTDDLGDYRLAGASLETGAIVAVRKESARTVWVADVDTIDRPRQVAADAGSFDDFDGLAITRDRRVVYTAMESGNVDVQTIDLRTGERRRLTTDRAADFHPGVSADGQLVAFVSERGGARGVWVMNIDGTRPRRLTTDADDWPSFSNDGRWVAVQRGRSDNMPATMWRVSVDSGEAIRVGPAEAIRPVFSPDGGSIAHYWMTPEHWSLAISPVDSKLPTRTLPITGTHAGRIVRWAPVARGLAFIDAAGGVPNVWLQPLDGSPPRALTHLADGRMVTFDWSRDGKTLAWTRVTTVGDVVTIPFSRTSGS
jgi:Tol biopolymer transport system component/DNA-binding winged helix-turn-helix (wHTH) protein